MTNTNTNTQSTLTNYKWRQLAKQTGVSKGKMLNLLDRCSTGNDVIAVLDTLFA